MNNSENNPFVGFNTFTKQRTEEDDHPFGEDSHLDDDSILERSGDVETDDNYYEPDDYDEDDDVDLQWGKVSDAAKGAVGAAKSGVSQAAKTVQTAGQAAGAKVGQAAQTAGYAAQDAASTGIAAGQKAAKTAGQAATGLGQQAAQTATGLGQQAAQTASVGLTAGKQAAQTAGTAAGAKVAGAFGKSHDDMMASLEQAIGFMEKQVDTDEQAFDDEPTGSRTAVQNVSRRGTVEENAVDPLETPDDFTFTPKFNESQIAAIEEASWERQQGIAANKKYEAERAVQIAAIQEAERKRQQGIAANTKYEAERAVPSSREQDQGQYPEANVFPSPEAGPSPSHFSEEELLDSLRVPEGRKRRGVLTPKNISTSAKMNRMEAEDLQRRKDKRTADLAQRSQIKTRRESTALTPMEKPKRPPISGTGDDVSQSADSVLAKALGSVIGIMEKQDERKIEDPRFRCQECGTKIPKGSRSCRKCGSEDIDLA